VCHHIECARRLILSSTVQPLTDAQVYWADALLEWGENGAEVSDRSSLAGGPPPRQRGQPTAVS
jgi:hypothetical protein